MTLLFSGQAFSNYLPPDQIGLDMGRVNHNVGGVNHNVGGVNHNLGGVNHNVGGTNHNVGRLGVFHGLSIEAEMNSHSHPSDGYQRIAMVTLMLTEGSMNDLTPCTLVSRHRQLTQTPSPICPISGTHTSESRQLLIPFWY